MAYIHIKKKGKKRYYYLRHSLRKDKKIYPKNLHNLGTEISKVSLENLKNKYPKEVSPSYENLKKRIEKIKLIEETEKTRIKENKYFEKKNLVEIKSIISHFRKIKKEEKKKIMYNFEIKFITENISADCLEKISPPKIKETKNLLEKNITPKNKSLSQIYRIINTKKILKYIKKEKPKINQKLILKISSLLTENPTLASDFRKNGSKIPQTKINISKPLNIKRDLEKLISWYNKNKTKIHPLALVILFHHKFEKIHPFSYSNGEIGRILMNYQLSEFNYPPIIISINLRGECYKAMDKAYHCLKKDLLNTDMKYYKSLIDFMYKQFVKTYWENFN